MIKSKKSFKSFPTTSDEILLPLLVILFFSSLGFFDYSLMFLSADQQIIFSGSPVLLSKVQPSSFYFY